MLLSGKENETCSILPDTMEFKDQKLNRLQNIDHCVNLFSCILTKKGGPQYSCSTCRFRCHNPIHTTPIHHSISLPYLRLLGSTKQGYKRSIKSQSKYMTSPSVNNYLPTTYMPWLKLQSWNHKRQNQHQWIAFKKHKQRKSNCWQRPLARGRSHKDLELK